MEGISEVIERILGRIVGRGTDRLAAVDDTAQGGTCGRVIRDSAVAGCISNNSDEKVGDISGRIPDGDRRPSDRQEKVAERDGGGGTFGHRQLRQLLIEEADLVAAGNTTPPQTWRWRVAVIQQPGALPCAVAVGGLPNLGYPIAVYCPLPITEGRLWHAMEFEGSRFRWMLENAAPTPDGRECRSETAAVLVDPVAPSLCIDGGKLMPSVARWMSHDRMAAAVEACVPVNRPRINTIDAKVTAIRFDEERGNHCATSENPPDAVGMAPGVVWEETSSIRTDWLPTPVCKRELDRSDPSVAVLESFGRRPGFVAVGVDDIVSARHGFVLVDVGRIHLEGRVTRLDGSNDSAAVRIAVFLAGNSAVEFDGSNLECPDGLVRAILGHFSLRGGFHELLPSVGAEQGRQDNGRLEHLYARPDAPWRGRMPNRSCLGGKSNIDRDPICAVQTVADDLVNALLPAVAAQDRSTLTRMRDDGRAADALADDGSAFIADDLCEPIGAPFLLGLDHPLSGLWGFSAHRAGTQNEVRRPSSPATVSNTNNGSIGTSRPNIEPPTC